MSTHAPLAPSFAPVWGFCSGAPMASQKIPNADTEASRNGTAAHWVFSETSLNIRDARPGPRECAGYMGAVAPNGVVIDDEMCEGAQIMVDDVFAVFGSYVGTQRQLLIEAPVAAPRVHETLNYGTLDAAVISPGKIYIWDYKHGRREKNAKGNLQLTNYLEGVATYLGANGYVDQRTAVSMRIVQPFAFRACGPVDEWCGTLSDVRADVNRLINQAEQAFTRPTLTPGAHCRDCPANGVCSAAKKYGYALDELARSPYAMDEMTTKDLATERDILTSAIAAAKGRLASIDDALTAAIKRGDGGDCGLTLEVGHGREKFTCSPEIAIAIASQFRADIRKHATLTPKQAKAKVPAELRKYFEEAIKEHTTTPTTGVKLTNIADSKTAKAFQRK